MSGVLDSRVHDMELRYYRTKGMPLDSKQMLMGELYRQDKEDTNRVDFIGGKPIDQRFGVSDVYMTLDTCERDFNSSDISQGLFVFNLRREGITGDGYIGMKHDLHDIIEIEAMSFIFPDLPCYKYQVNPDDPNHPGCATDSLLPMLVPNSCPNECIPPGPDITPTDLCDPPECPCPDYLSQIQKRRFSVQIKEVYEQSISDTDNKKHSLEYDLLNINEESRSLGSIYASPINFGYIFTDPITSLETLTMVFRNSAGTPLIFNQDCFNNAVLDAMTFTYTNQLPDIPLYTQQYLEIAVNTEDSSPCTNYKLGVMQPNYQLHVRNMDVKNMSPKLYKYLTHCTQLLVGANGYDPTKSLRLNPDVVITEFLDAYSRHYELLSVNSGYLTIGRESKQITLDHNNQILLREWVEIPQPPPLAADPLPAGDQSFHKFIEGKQFNIGTTKICRTDQIITYNGSNYKVAKLSDIYYDRVVMTLTTEGPPIINILITQGGLFTGLRKTIVAVPKSTPTRVKLRANQYVVRPNIRTDIYDLEENRQFTFAGQYINRNNPAVLENKTILMNRTTQSIRLFHQGTDSDGNILETNRVYHLDKVSDIYADKVVLTAGLNGAASVQLVLARNRIRIPLRFRILLRRMTNMLAP